ncbi:MAG: hypothetical protein AB7S41_11465 [Parvibaculaceae bacterium]
MVRNFMLGAIAAVGIGLFAATPTTPAHAGVGVTIGVPGVYIHAGDRDRHRYGKRHHRYYGHRDYDRHSLGPSKRVCKTKYTSNGYKRVCKTRW